MRHFTFSCNSFTFVFIVFLGFFCWGEKLRRAVEGAGVQNKEFELENVFRGDEFMTEFDYIKDGVLLEGYTANYINKKGPLQKMVYLNGNRFVVKKEEDVDCKENEKQKGGSIKLYTKKKWNTGLFVFSVNHVPQGKNIRASVVFKRAGNNERSLVGRVNFITGPTHYSRGAFLGHQSSGNNIKWSGKNTVHANSLNSSRGCSTHIFVFELMPNKKKVKVWLFPVSDTPQDLLNEKPTPSSWDMKPTTIQMTYEKNNKNSQDDDNENDYLDEQSLKYKLIDAAEGILNDGFNVGIELSYYEDSEEDDNNDEEKKQSGNNNNKNNYINNSINDDKLQTDDADDIFHSPTAITNMCVLSVPGAFWEISYLKVYQNNLPKPKNNAKIDESENDEQTDHRTTPSSSTMRNNNSNNNSQNSPDWRSLFKGACEDYSADTNNNVDKTNKDSPTALVDNLKEQLAKLTNTNNKNLLTPSLPTTLNLPTLNLSSPPNLTQALKLDPSSLQNDLEAKYNDLTAQTKKTFEDFQEKLSGLINTKPPCSDPLDLSDLGINKSAVNDLLTLNPSDLPALLGTLSVSNKRDVNDALAVCNRFVNKGRKLLSSNLNIHNNVECIEDTKKGNNNAIQQNNKNEKEEENEQSTYSSSPSYPAIATSLSSSLTQDKEKNATYLEEEKHEHIKTVGIELPIMQRLRRLMTEEKRESVLEKKHDVRTLVSSTSRSHSPAYKEEESNEDEEQSYRNGFSAASRRLQVVTPSFPRVARSLHGSPHLLVSYVPLALLSLGQKVEGGKHLIGSAVAKGVENRVEAAHNVRYTAADLLENSIPAAVIAGAGVGTPSRSFSLHGEGVDMLSPKLLTGGNGDDMQPLTLVGNDIQMPINESHNLGGGGGGGGGAGGGGGGAGHAYQGGVETQFASATGATTGGYNEDGINTIIHSSGHSNSMQVPPVIPRHYMTSFPNNVDEIPHFRGSAVGTILGRLGEDKDIILSAGKRNVENAAGATIDFVRGGGSRMPTDRSYSLRSGVVGSKMLRNQYYGGHINDFSWPGVPPQVIAYSNAVPPQMNATGNTQSRQEE